MTIDAAFKKIDRYLKKENIGPLVVDAQNQNDLDAIVTHYKYLSAVSKELDYPANLIRSLFRTILNFDSKDKEFLALYESRKAILNAIGNPVDEVVNYCQIVLSMEQNAIHYLTDNTLQERELIFRILQ